MGLTYSGTVCTLNGTIVTWTGQAASEQIVPMRVLGQKLRSRAKELGFSNAEVARRAGLSERRYGFYVTGDREPDLSTLLRICKVLATTPNILLGVSDDGK